MKFSLVFCGFLLVWHPGNVFVRSADIPPTTTDAPTTAAAGPTTTTAKRTTDAAPASVTTTSNPDVPPGSSAAPSNSTANTTEIVTKITTDPANSTTSTAAQGGVTPVSPVTTTSSATTAATVLSATTTPTATTPTITTPTATTPTPTTPTPTTPTPTTPTITTPTITTPTITTPTITTPTTMTPTTTTPPTINVIISETNLLLADNNFFVELSGPVGGSLSGITLVVYNATNNTELNSMKFGAEDKLNTNGLYVLNLNDTEKYMDTALLVLYKPDNSTRGKKMMDFIIASESTSAAGNVASALKEQLGMTDKPIIIVNRKNLVAMNISGDISLIRCHKGGEPDPSTLIISYTSKGDVNNCTFPNDTRHGFEFKVVTSVCMEWDKSITMKLQDVIINNVNEKCQCGMTSSLFYNAGWAPQDKCSSNEGKSTTNVLSGKFVGMFASQTRAIQEAYTTYVMTSPNITVDARTFTVTNCSLLCVLPPPHIPSKDKGNPNLTVAVVLSCVAVFLIILVAVVIYLRRQRRGVLQFRMTRLAEDDDMEDMEDFVGGPMDDHEPSFNNSRYKASR